MPSSPGLARAARKIEEMEQGDGSLLDTICGSITRLFVRVNQIEQMNQRLLAKLTALERERDEDERRAGARSTQPTKPGNA
jgi:hypothetical protein